MKAEIPYKHRTKDRLARLPKPCNAGDTHKAYWAGYVEASTAQIENADTHPIQETRNALDTQIGGSHYKDCKIQPVEFIEANEIPFLEGNVIKYTVRHASKNGKADLEKAKHYLDLLIQFRYPDGGIE